MAAVTLFGSRARGEAAPESDWDLLVIAKNLPERVMKHHALLK
ncbi:nucleotidyltransferase domain-containing protein, partial [Roseiflexus sp.]